MREGGGLGIKGCGSRMMSRVREGMEVEIVDGGWGVREFRDGERDLGERIVELEWGVGLVEKVFGIVI